LQQSPASRVTKVMLRDAAAVAGMTFTDGELDAMLEAVNLNVGRLEEIRKRVLGINGTENRVKATEVLQNHPLSLALQNFSQKGRVLKTTFATRNRLKILWASLSAKIRNSAKTNVQVPDRRSGSYR
jgi:hypothetical protein